MEFTETKIKEYVLNIFEKEKLDLKNGRMRWERQNSYITSLTFENLRAIYALIEANEDYKTTYIKLLNDSLLLPEESYLDRVIGVSHLGLLTLVSLGFGKIAFEILLQRPDFSLLLMSLVNDLLSCNNAKFDYEELELIKRFVKKEMKLTNRAYHLEILRASHEKIINLQFNIIDDNLKNINIEINVDKKSVQNKIFVLGLNKELSDFLDEVDKFLFVDTSEFVNAAMIGNLRSFMENTLKVIANKISHKTGEPIKKQENRGEMGNVRLYLKEKLNLHENEDRFINHFINILHNEGGHAFTSEKEYFRLSRNIAIEIVLLVLSKYEKLI